MFSGASKQPRRCKATNGSRGGVCRMEEKAKPWIDALSVQTECSRAVLFICQAFGCLAVVREELHKGECIGAWREQHCGCLPGCTV